MAEYRLYVLDSLDRIRAAARLVECASDDEATSLAAALLREHPAVEVWCGTRFVCRLGTDASLSRESG